MNSKISQIIASLFVLLLFLIPACNLPQNEPTPDLEAIVAQTQTAIAVNQYLASATPVQVTPMTGTAQPLDQATMDATTTTQQAVVTTPSASQIPATSTAVPINCTNAAKYEGETIPDNSVLAPGQEFLKTWTIRNVGTCTWSPEYALVFVRGDQMGGTSPAPIGETVTPGGTILLRLPQKAPQSQGTFQGFWKLRSQAGQEFGLGQTADIAFWVKINVVAGASNNSGGTFTGPQNLGSPSWIATFDDRKSPWFLGTDSNIDYQIKDGQLIITALQLTGDQWRVAQPGYLEDFYLQAKFTNGPVCSGKDGYGLIVRAPDKPNGVINSGYVFSFSCDGYFRVYRMDNGNFTGIQNWKSHPSIKPGSAQTNVMGIYVLDEIFQLYSNGVLIYELSDQTYSGGLFGLVIRAETTINYKVFVDDVTAWVVP